MDKHICKAKRMDSGEWVYGYLIIGGEEYKYLDQPDLPFSNVYISNTLENVYTDFNLGGSKLNISVPVYHVIPDTVCRCTGWHDSYKTPIFERDVVEFTIGSCKDRHLIWWNNEMNMLTAVPLDGIQFNGWDYWNGDYPQFEYSTFCLMMQDPYGDFSDIKVIGNIIDNAELMEE